MGCLKTLSLPIETGGEMPLDSAVYVSSVDKIFGCDGAYVHQCDPATGARESSVRVTGPVLGPTSIAYHAANGNLYLAGWFDPSWVDMTDTFPSPRADIYPIDPATLTVGAPLGIRSIFPALQPPGNRFGMNGPHTLLSLGSYLYFLYRYQSGGGAPYRINPSNTSQNNTNASAGWNAWNSWQAATDGSFYYLCDPELVIWKAPLDFSGVAALWDMAEFSDDDQTPVACEVAGSDVYAVCGNGNLMKVTMFEQFGPGTWSALNLETVQANVKPFKLRYNSNDGLLYIPCQNEDCVIVWNPADDTGELKSGFDGPVDCVFTSDAAFAVQSGPQGLKAIT